MRNSKTVELFESYQENLNEKINKDNEEVNRVLANPNAGKNKEKIKAMGYETEETSDGKVFGIRNPKTKRWLDPSEYSREDKKKVDFKNQLDTEKKSRQGKYYPEYVPKGIKTGKGKGYASADRDEMAQYSDGISQNIKDYKKAVKDRKDAESSVEHADKSMDYYEDKVKKAQRDLEFHKKYRDNRQKDAYDAEDRRKDVLHRVRVARGMEESEELDESTYRNLGWDLDIELDDADNIVNVSTENEAKVELLDSSDMKFIGIVKVHKTPYLLFKQADGIKAVKFANGMYDSFELDLKNESEELVKEDEEVITKAEETEVEEKVEE